LVVVNAHSFGQGIGRAAALVTILAFLWQLRSGVDRVARFEETVAHKLVAQAVVALVPTAWWLTAALQWLCFGVGMTSLWAMFAVPEFAGTGVVWLMLGWFIKTSRADWGRPREPLIVNAREIKLAITGGTAIERRTSLLLGALVCATLVIAFVQEL